MKRNQGCWIIGYNEDFDFIIIGENTGPYSDFPKIIPHRLIKGYFYCLNNFVGQIDKEGFEMIKLPAFSKCSCLDELNGNVVELHKPFKSPEEIMSYLGKLAEPFFRRVYLSKMGRTFLDKFSVEGLIPN